MLSEPVRRPGAAALDGSLSLALEVCGPEPPNESIVADHYRAWYPSAGVGAYTPYPLNIP